MTPGKLLLGEGITVTREARQQYGEAPYDVWIVHLRATSKGSLIRRTQAVVFPPLHSHGFFTVSSFTPSADSLAADTLEEALLLAADALRADNAAYRLGALP